MSLVTVTWAWAKEGNSFASAGHMSQLMSSKRTAKERQPRAATCQQECTPITQSAHSWGGKPWETSYNFGLGMWKGDTKTEFAVQNRCSGHSKPLTPLSASFNMNSYRKWKWGYPFDSHILYSQSSWLTKLLLPPPPSPSPTPPTHLI